MTIPTNNAAKAGRNSKKLAKPTRQPGRNAGAKSAAKAKAPAGRSKPRASTLAPSEQIDRHIAGISDFRGAVLANIRRIMLEADPAVTEDWKWMGSPVWYCDGMICVANSHRGKVKVTFHKGARIADPEHLFNADLNGKEWRAIDIFENDRLDEAALGRLVKTAIAYNRSQQKNKKKQKAVRAGRKK